jgi:hypothetical protein
MNVPPIPRFLVVTALVVLSALSSPEALADAVPPVQIMVKELPSGAFDVQWRVPKVMAPQAMPSPRLPDGCTPEGERTFVDRPSAWLIRQTYQCPNGLAGQTLGVHHPLYNIGLSTVLRVEFLSGARYAHMLEPGEDSWLVPDAGAGGFAGILLDARQAVLDGAAHFFRGWVHIAFLLVICFVGGMRVRVRLATTFLLAQVTAVAVTSLSGLRVDPALAEIGVALATVLLAREALRPAPERKQLVVLAACAGVVHGLGLQGVFAAGQEGAPNVLFLFFTALGMDVALLISVALLSAIAHIVTRPVERIHVARPAAVYATAGVACALAIGGLINGSASATKQSDRRLQLPAMVSSSQGTAQTGSRRVAATTLDAAIQSFVSVERFEVRHEILVRLRDVAERFGTASTPELAIARQDDVKERISELVLALASLDIDGESTAPISTRVDFLTVSDQGVLPRPEPVPESIETAWVGVTAVYLTKTTARDIEMVWEFIDEAPAIPVTVIDPESSISSKLTVDEPAIAWKNELSEEWTPITAMAVEPNRFILPTWSLVPLIIAFLFTAAAIRRRSPVLNASARAMFAFAVLLGPVHTVAIAVPWSTSAAPGAGEARRILAVVLPNIYRALEFREETAVFDRLALSVSGEALTEVYLDQRRVLEAEDRGGARARVEAVEIVDVTSIEPAGDDGFVANAIWTVGGTVTHFGHRHFRQNRYDARINIVPEQGTWKLQSIELLEEERLR